MAALAGAEGCHSNEGAGHGGGGGGGGVDAGGVGGAGLSCHRKLGGRLYNKTQKARIQLRLLGRCVR